MINRNQNQKHNINNKLICVNQLTWRSAEYRTDGKSNNEKMGHGYNKLDEE